MSWVVANVLARSDARAGETLGEATGVRAAVVIVIVVTVPELPEAGLKVVAVLEWGRKKGKRSQTWSQCPLD